MEELWKPVVGYEGLYEISNLGRFKSLAKILKKGINHRFMVDRILPGYNVKGRYTQVQLWKNGKYIIKGVHRLVLEAFVPKSTNERLEANHKNGNKYDNRLENLEWVTSKQNKVHAFQTGLCNHRRGEGLYNAKLTEENVKWIRNNYKNYSQAELSKKFNVGRSCIWGIINKKGWKHI